MSKIASLLFVELMWLMLPMLLAWFLTVTPSVRTMSSLRGLGLGGRGKFKTKTMN